MKRTIILFCTVVFAQFLQAQGPMLDSARNELYRINQVFDNSRYLGFNMDIGYRVDSLNVTVGTEQMSGSYVLNKENLYYNMGGTEYIQTDSFSYTIYADSKIMIMAKNAVQQNSALFPLKTFVDSVIGYYDSHYDITIDTVHIDTADYFKQIIFTFDSTGSSQDSIPLKYTSFSIQYDERSYLPSKFSFSYQENGYQFADDSTVSGTIKLDKHVDMSFSNYSAFSNTGIFNDMQYIIFNRQRKMYEPAQKYKDYQFITAGFENDDEEAQYYREVPAAGN
jgi:hypothetical protein